jgi:hypothetical protein
MVPVRTSPPRSAVSPRPPATRRSREYVLLRDLPSRIFEETASTLVRDGYVPLGGVILEAPQSYCQAFWLPPRPHSFDSHPLPPAPPPRRPSTASLR